MQTDQVVILHNEVELRNFMRAAITLFAEKAANLQPPAPSAQPSVIRSSTLAALPRPTSSRTSTAVTLRPSVVKSAELPQARQANEPRDENVDNPFFLSHSISHFETGPQVPPTPLPGDSREGLYVDLHAFVRIPLVVDVWVTRCASNVDISKYMQPKHFAGGFVVWSILHHYFPRDAQLSAFHEPQTRVQYAEIWSQVDLILQKHGLVRIPAEIIGGVMEYRQAGQAVLLMTLYETLTNLKLAHPIPQIYNPCRKKNKCNTWNFQHETLSNTAKRPASFEQMLQRMYSTNQRMAFSKAQRVLRPPRLNRQDESRTDIDMGVTEKEIEQSRLQRLTRGPHGDRCYLYHADKTELLAEHYERQVSNLVSRTPKLARLDGPPFFKTDPSTKSYRVPVKEQLAGEIPIPVQPTGPRVTELSKKKKNKSSTSMATSTKHKIKTPKDLLAIRRSHRATPKLERRTPEEPAKASLSTLETVNMTENLPVNQVVPKAKSKSTTNVDDGAETLAGSASVLLSGPPFFPTDPLKKTPRVNVRNTDAGLKSYTEDAVFLQSPFFDGDPLHKVARAKLQTFPNNNDPSAELNKPFFDKDSLTKQPRVGVSFTKTALSSKEEPLLLQTPFFIGDALQKTPRVTVQRADEANPKPATDLSVKATISRAEKKISSPRLTVLQTPFFTTDPLSQSRNSLTKSGTEAAVATVKLQPPFYQADPLSKRPRVPVESTTTHMTLCHLRNVYLASVGGGEQLRRKRADEA
ncbi:hypothetical protein RvY_16431 [Ramazzottius varieornatus]|uniref:Uncharacterized protein n=1 Tax=Ramazzottius varieornatus TaxID=947166 RepID=A0A1D1VYE5_RAMVA|nr:hypothetical protein RvY_16431 [Ramazzottius varieornatus]